MAEKSVEVSNFNTKRRQHQRRQQHADLREQARAGGGLAGAASSSSGGSPSARGGTSLPLTPASALLQGFFADLQASGQSFPWSERGPLRFVAIPCCPEAATRQCQQALGAKEDDSKSGDDKRQAPIRDMDRSRLKRGPLDDAHEHFQGLKENPSEPEPVSDMQEHCQELKGSPPKPESVDDAQEHFQELKGSPGEPGSVDDVQDHFQELKETPGEPGSVDDVQEDFQELKESPLEPGAVDLELGPVHDAQGPGQEMDETFRTQVGKRRHARTIAAPLGINCHGGGTW